MLVTIQFPILDLRGFVADTGRLRKPPWPIPDPRTDFVRRFGPIERRPRGGVPGWLGEAEVCNARHAIRCDRALPINVHSHRFLRVAFRRFYFDGLAVGKLEVGFATKRPFQRNVRSSEIENIVSRVLALPVRVATGGDQVTTELISAGTRFAEAYGQATTRVRHDAAPGRLVRNGAPLLLVECGFTERCEVPFYARRLNLPDGTALSHCLVPHGSHAIRLWFVNQHKTRGSYFSHASLDQFRHLRLYLQRLHAEHECLRLALRSVVAGRIDINARSPESDAFQHYVNEATKRIGVLRSKTEAALDDSIYSLALTATTAIRPGEIAALRQVLDRLDIRPNIRRKIDRYAEEWNNITIIEHVEHNYMGDVFKDITNSIIATRGSIAEGVVQVRSQHNDEVADSIQTLDELIASVSDSELPAKKRNECLELLKGLTDEVKKPAPCKPIMKTIGESLMGTLSTVATIANSVATCFDVLKPLWS